MKFQLLTILAVFPFVFGALEVPSVKLTVYYESLCPDSRAFVLHQLVSTYSKLGKHIHLELVPFGNENITLTNGTPTYSCQHGPAECWGNKMEACAIAHAQTQLQGLNYVACMFNKTNWKETQTNGEVCAKEFEFNQAKLSVCHDQAEGRALIQVNQQKTDSLMPKRTNVPWININGQHTENIQSGALSHLEMHLCINYLLTVPECKVN